MTRNRVSQLFSILHEDPSDSIYFSPHLILIFAYISRSWFISAKMYSAIANFNGMYYPFTCKDFLVSIKKHARTGIDRRKMIWFLRLASNSSYERCILADVLYSIWPFSQPTTLSEHIKLKNNFIEHRDRREMLSPPLSALQLHQRWEAIKTIRNVPWNIRVTMNWTSREAIFTSLFSHSAKLIRVILTSPCADSSLRSPSSVWVCAHLALIFCSRLTMRTTLS